MHYYQLYSWGDLKAVKHLFEAVVVEAAKGCPEAGDGDYGRPLLAEDVFGGGQGAEGLSVLLDGLQVEAGVQLDGAEQVVQDAVRRHGGQVPFQNVQNNHLPLLEKSNEKIHKYKWILKLFLKVFF